MRHGGRRDERNPRGAPISALLLAVALLAGATLARAEPEVFRVNQERSTAEFAVSYFGIFRQHGRFGRTEGTIVLDAEDHAGSVDLSVDASSIDTGWSIGDAWLRSEDMFDVEHFPSMRFQSSRLVFDHSRLVEVIGSLTLRGVTRPVSLKIDRVECSRDHSDAPELCGASAVSRIRRSDFGLSYGLGFIADDIDLSFRIAASRLGTLSASRP